jgi:hypothetical protein
MTEDSDWSSFYNALCWKMSEIQLGGKDFYMIIEKIDHKNSANRFDPSLFLNMQMRLWPKENFPGGHPEMKQIEDKSLKLEPALKAIEDKSSQPEVDDDILDVEVA